jgi:predicted metal-dependent HD superfamily phosphohydrolase
LETNNPLPRKVEAELTSRARWQSMWKQLGAAGADEELFHWLVECYSEPHRKYHTLQHLNECLAHFERVNSLAEQPDEVELALWFHDAIYDTKRKDNEQRSAAWARASVVTAGLSEEQANRIYQLIIATMHNAIPAGRDAEVLVDIDLAILGSDTTRFDEYEAQVRAEYAWVPESLYRAARTQVLEGFLKRERIYSTEFYHSAYETRARENIARSLARL